MWHGGEWSGARIHFIALLPDAAKQADPVEGISVAGFQHPAASAGQLHTGIITATVIEMNPTEELMIPGADLPQVLEQRFSEHGILLKKSGGVWQYPSSDAALLDAVNSDAFAFAAVKAEHRRWCYYMISIGWKYGEKDDTLRQNPCLVGWATLTQTQPTLCKYDLIPLIVKYEGGRDQWD